MPRFVIEPMEATDGLVSWTKNFAGRMAKMTYPHYMADDLYQELYIVYEKIKATYSDKPADEVLKLYKWSARKRVYSLLRETKKLNRVHYGLVFDKGTEPVLYPDETLEEFSARLENWFAAKEFPVNKTIAAVKQKIDDHETQVSFKEVIKRVGRQRLRQMILG